MVVKFHTFICYSFFQIVIPIKYEHIDIFNIRWPNVLEHCIDKFISSHSKLIRFHLSYSQRMITAYYDFVMTMDLLK